MENAGYTTLNRQIGLLREMQAVANNIANMATTGYRAEGVIFSEVVRDVGPGRSSLSMSDASVPVTDLSQGAMKTTGRTFDFAIEGPGFFRVATASGDQLTRAGSFTPNAEGVLSAPDGAALLDLGGAPVVVPPGASRVELGADGTLSADGFALTQIGVVEPVDPLDRPRSGTVRFAPEGAVEPVPSPRILQGALEASNVNPVREIARMIEVQRAYELGQSFLDRDDERVRTALRTLTS